MNSGLLWGVLATDPRFDNPWWLSWVRCLESRLGSGSLALSATNLERKRRKEGVF